MTTEKRIASPDEIADAERGEIRYEVNRVRAEDGTEQIELTTYHLDGADRNRRDEAIRRIRSAAKFLERQAILLLDRADALKMEDDQSIETAMRADRKLRSDLPPSPQGWELDGRRDEQSFAEYVRDIKSFERAQESMGQRIKAIYDEAQDIYDEITAYAETVTGREIDWMLDWGVDNTDLPPATAESARYEEATERLEVESRRLAEDREKLAEDRRRLAVERENLAEERRRLADNAR